MYWEKEAFDSQNQYDKYELIKLVKSYEKEIEKSIHFELPLNQLKYVH